MVVFALGLAIRYLLMDNEDRIYDHVEHKQKLTSLDHKATFTVGVTDQVEGSEQVCSNQKTKKQIKKEDCPQCRIVGITTVHIVGDC